jgi:hypothetical protein
MGHSAAHVHAYGHVRQPRCDFVPLAAEAHPILMGQPFAFGFPELDPFIKPLFEEGTRSE